MTVKTRKGNKRKPAARKKPAGLRGKLDITPARFVELINGLGAEIVTTVNNGMNAAIGARAHGLHLVAENRRLIQRIHELEQITLDQHREIQRLKTRPEAMR